MSPLPFVSADHSDLTVGSWSSLSSFTAVCTTRSLSMIETWVAMLPAASNVAIGSGERMSTTSDVVAVYCLGRNSVAPTTSGNDRDHDQQRDQVACAQSV